MLLSLFLMLVGGWVGGVGLQYLQAPPWAVLRDDAHVWGFDAAADEASQMLVLNISHLQRQEGRCFKF